MAQHISLRMVEIKTKTGIAVRMERWAYTEIKNTLLGLFPAPGHAVPLEEIVPRTESAVPDAARIKIKALRWNIAAVRADLEGQGILVKQDERVVRVR